MRKVIEIDQELSPKLLEYVRGGSGGGNNGVEPPREQNTTPVC